MRKSDVLVIGSGLSGLMSAICLAKSNKKVTVLTKGAGTLFFGNGGIDLLGYLKGKPIVNPLEELNKLPQDHPYQLVGSETIYESIDFFSDLCSEYGYELIQNNNTNRWIPTIAGTLKPGYLVPNSMNANDLTEAKNIKVLSFTGLKDFYPSLVVKGLKLNLPQTPSIESIEINLNLNDVRDMSLLDIARYLDSSEGKEVFLAKLSEKNINQGDYILVPPVLGLEPNLALWRELEIKLKVRIIELVSTPPGVVGLRLYKMLLKALNDIGVTIVEQAHVVKANYNNYKIESVVTSHFGRERIYVADDFILATGSYLGGGLVAENNKVTEPIFSLPVANITNETIGFNEKMFSSVAQPFMTTGIKINKNMKPIDADSNVIFTNLYAVGNILANFDYATEKSGSGVSLATAYKAAREVLKGAM